MSAQALTTLVDIPLHLETAASGIHRYTANERFRLPVVLTSRHVTSLRWNAESPLTLSYRWLDLPADVAAPESERTYLPTEDLAPGKPIRLTVEGMVPAHTGKARLCVSLILESVHWAADIASPGAIEVPVHITANLAWPDEARKLPGGKALRGGLLAAALEAEIRRSSRRQQDLEAATNSRDATLGDDLAEEELAALTIRQQRRIIDLLLAIDERDARIAALELELHQARGAAAMPVVPSRTTG